MGEARRRKNRAAAAFVAGEFDHLFDKPDSIDLGFFVTPETWAAASETERAELVKATGGNFMIGEHPFADFLRRGCDE